MEDPRESSRTKKKRAWVQVASEAQYRETEPERIVGRDISENIESTTAVSSVQKTKTSAESAPNTNTGNGNSATAPGRSDKLTTLQSVFESGQRETNARLDKLFSYVKGEMQARDLTIARLKETEKNYYSICEEHNSLKDDYNKLLDKAHTFKLTSIISTSLFLLVMGISIFVCYYIF